MKIVKISNLLVFINMIIKKPELFIEFDRMMVAMFHMVKLFQWYSGCSFVEFLANW